MRQIARHGRRRAVFKRDNNRCQYCGKGLGPRNRTIDHLTPKAKGGCNKVHNLVAACDTCNAAKGNMLPLNFIWMRTKPTQRLAEVA